jgi:tetratricopeptide (TPR) repeat protein
MICRALLSGLLLALVAQAQGKDVIHDEDLEPQFRELQGRIEQARNNALKPGELVSFYQQQAQVAGGSARDQAVRHFMYGVVLTNVVSEGKGTKEAKREFARAIELVPGFLPAHIELAILANAAKDSKEADRLLRRALELDHEYGPAYEVMGQISLTAGDLDRARSCYENAVARRPTLPSLSGLVTVYVALYRKTYDEKEKDGYAKRALAAASSAVTLDPDNHMLQLLKGKVLLDLERPDEAIQYLEGLYATGTLPAGIQLRLLAFLREIYMQSGDVENVRSTMQRMLKNEKLQPEQKTQLSDHLKDLDKMGRNAFVKWVVEDLLQTLHNPGLGVEERVSVLRKLWEFMSPKSGAINVPELRPLIVKAWRECFRVLVDGTPELVVTQLRALRNTMPPSARLTPVLVHFVLPNGKTPEIREEGVRTIAVLAGKAAIPAIYYSLQDDAGRVVREADSQLSILCERRSPLGGTIEGYTPEQAQKARRFWTSYFHSEEGAKLLAQAIVELQDAVVKVQSTDLTSAPMIDHAANILLDDDMPWVAWAASYDFLVQYWGKEFRPVERRGKPVEPSERALVVQAFEKDFRGEEGTAPAEPPPPETPKGMAKGK